MAEQRFQQYRLLQRLAHSASGDLYLVAAEGGAQELLLQQLPLALPAEKLAQDLRWMARPVAALGRPAVSRVVAWGQSDDGNLYLVFEGAAGESLQALIPGAPEKLEPAAALTLVGQIAHMLERGLKAGIIHKLLLPHYLFVQEGQPPTVLGLDLPATLANGLLPVLPEEELVYLSPEQRLGNVIDGRSNIYSLGALLYGLLTGEPPLPAGPGGQRHAPLAERRPDLAQATVRLVETCLQPNSWMRFQTYSALRYAIAQAAGAESPSEATAAVTYPVVPANLYRRPRLQSSLAPLLVVAILFLVAAAVALGGGAWLLFGGDGLDEMAVVEMPTATRLVPMGGSGEELLLDEPTPPLGPTPTLLATSTPGSEAASGAAVDGLATPTSRVEPTRTRAVAGELRGDNGEGSLTPSATTPARVSTPRPTLSPTTAPAIQPSATPTGAPPTPLPTATDAPLPPPPPPPPPTATSEPSPTAEPQPTATHPVPATEPPPTPTPPLPSPS